MTDHHPMPEATGRPSAAAWWSRGKAAIVDFLIFVGLAILPGVPFVVGLVMGLEEKGASQGFGWGLVVIGSLGWLAVPVWSGWFFGYRQGVTGSTPGKRRLHIRLVDAGTDEPPGGARGVGRWLVPILVNLVVGVIFIVDYLWPLWDSKDQRLTDKIFSTRVVVAGSRTDEAWSPPNPIS